MLYAASLWLSNSSYLYLSVSFIQMTKSLMPGLVYFSGCIVGTERFTWSIVLDMTLIAFGVLVCAFGESNLIVGGLINQLTALLFEATRLTLVQVRSAPTLNKVLIDRINNATVPLAHCAHLCTHVETFRYSSTARV
jgi:hypothetical protein